MRRLTRRSLLPTAVAAALMLNQAATAQSRDAVGEPLMALYAGLEAAMRAGPSETFAQRFDALAPIVEQAFDLDDVLKMSVGMRWNAMDPEVQATLSTAFQRFTVATYVANFDKYEGERFQVLPGSRASGVDRIVRTAMISSSGERTRVDYRMRDVTGRWRAVDVLLDGSISRVAIQRSDFRKILGGGDTDALIASLRRKVAGLSDGALSS
jgi:phospholipid transport system substrate-binding protein